MRRGRSAGFSAIEVLVSLLLLSIVLAGAVGVFATQNRTYIQQDLSVAMEQNLRVGMAIVTDAVRNAGYGVPTSNLSTWIPWVSGFTTNPTLSGSTLSVAGCTLSPVATLSAAAAAGATTLSLTSVSGSSIASLVNTESKRLILIGDSENAHVRTVSDSTISIDTNPVAAGVSGLSRSYPAGTPVCRVDVATFAVSTSGTTGVPWLGMDTNQGSGAQAAADGISALTVTAVSAKQYQITLTARSENIDPVTRDYLTRTLTSNLTVKN
jgi:prepilin-type N-terminal cleavage/methylation domain-containing protein